MTLREFWGEQGPTLGDKPRGYQAVHKGSVEPMCDVDKGNRRVQKSAPTQGGIQYGTKVVTSQITRAERDHLIHPSCNQSHLKSEI